MLKLKSPNTLQRLNKVHSLVTTDCEIGVFFCTVCHAPSLTFETLLKMVKTQCKLKFNTILPLVLIYSNNDQEHFLYTAYHNDP